MNEIEYLTEPPKSIPPGRVLMHNIVTFGPNQNLGLHGLRAWLAEPGQPKPTTMRRWLGRPRPTRPDRRRPALNLTRQRGSNGRRGPTPTQTKRQEYFLVKPGVGGGVWIQDIGDFPGRGCVKT